MVIAIIGILAAMLLPALSKARQKARSISCTNNLKGLALQTKMYCDDNQGFFMPTREETISGKPFWYNYLLTFITGKSDTNYSTYKPLFCPEVKNPKNDPATFGYGPNAWYPGYGVCVYGPCRDGIHAQNPAPDYIVTWKDTEIKEQTRTILMGDSSIPDYYEYGYVYIDNIHVSDGSSKSWNWGKHGAGCENFSFVDGHVENIKCTRIEKWRKRIEDVAQYDGMVYSGILTE